MEFDNPIDAAKACKEMQEKYTKQILVKPFKDKTPFRIAERIKSEAGSDSENEDSENEDPSSPSKESEEPEDKKPAEIKSPVTKYKKRYFILIII